MSRRAALPSRILIPVANPRTAADLVRIGAALLERGGVLTALSIVEVPEGMSLSEGATRARQARRLLQRVLEFAPDGVDLRTVVRIGRRAAEGIVEVAAEDGADLIVFGWAGRPPGRRVDDDEPVFSATIDEVARGAPSDIAVVKQRGITDVGRILVPVRGGPHAELALRFAAALGTGFDAQVEALHVVGADLDPTLLAQSERALASFVQRHAGEALRPVVTVATDVGAEIVRAAASADLVVMGASVVGPAEGSLFGRLPESVATGAGPTVIVVRTRVAPTRATFEQRASQAETLEAAERAASNVRSVPARVGRWFAESSFHHGEYADLRRLMELKEKQGLTISAVLPTLNEAETIGHIVRAARTELMEKVPLLDELLVIDSDSTDDTRELAEAEGARVVRHPEVLSRYGSYVGKGEALWKSLYETSGDLVVWSDTDIRDWHPRFLYGTLGPLLTEPRIGYVKAYYQRPIVQDGQMKEGGGGRVTELVARPLINLFYPELSGYIQPLAGEYAGRREHLERIPFFTGYAVEMGHLIDLLERLGLNGFGQVDLDIRIHRNQELEGLSKMSFVILQAVMKRLEERRRVRLFAELGSTMKLPRSGPNELSLEVIELADAERPPMIRTQSTARSAAWMMAEAGAPPTGIQIEVMAPAAYESAIPGLAELLVDAVASGASVSFLAGLDLPRATAWWHDRAADVARGALVITVARDAGRIVGCAGLVAATAENSAHRAEVVKVLVLQSHRHRGIASAILEELERAALVRGRWLLILDTAVDVGAEALYVRTGWQDLGVVPDFAMGTAGRLVATRFMWKRLVP